MSLIKKRFLEIVKRVDPCETVCDVGCDHGKISYELLLTGKCKRVILTDISLPSLKKAERLIKPEFPNCKYVVSDGFDKVEDDFDSCIIAGMGGYSILKILRRYKKVKAVLQPMHDVEVLRLWLVENGYAIIKDEIVEDNGFYNIIKVEEGKDSLKPMEVVFGRTNLTERSADFISYLETELKKKSKMLKGIPENSEKFEEISKYIEQIKEIL